MAAMPTSSAIPSEPITPNRSERAVILVVDDEPSVLSAIRRLLQREGFITKLASSGLEGLAQLNEHDVDLVISDMRMPGMDGAQFLKQVYAKNPEISRLLLTGYADIGATISAINEGRIFRYITKPWIDAELIQCVHDALEVRALRRSNLELMALTQRQNVALQEANQSLEARVEARTAELQEGVRNFVCEAYDVNQEHVCQAGRRQRRQRPQRQGCRPFPRNSLTSLSLAR